MVPAGSPRHQTPALHVPSRMHRHPQPTSSVTVGWSQSTSANTSEHDRACMEYLNGTARRSPVVHSRSRKRSNSHTKRPSLSLSVAKKRQTRSHPYSLPSHQAIDLKHIATPNAMQQQYRRLQGCSFCLSQLKRLPATAIIRKQSGAVSQTGAPHVLQAH
jgi:hypothetical protein